MKRKAKCQLLILLTLLLGGTTCSAFSLLGPYADWMTQTNGYRQTGDIGGPMNIGQGYRWNVPIVTSAFDQSFLDFFGSNGVTAVEQAIQILNRLPRASNIVLTNYPLDSTRENFAAEGQNLYDLKSLALSLLLEQMGLDEPVRNVYTIRRVDPFLLSSPFQIAISDQPWLFPYNIIERNFDPNTLASSYHVNAGLYDGYIYCRSNSGVLEFADVGELNLNFDFPLPTAVADRSVASNPGFYHTGLTRDDVGGLRYLLRAKTVNYETLLPDVGPTKPPLPPPRRGAPPPLPYGIGPPADHFVNGALRPGVEKITFVRHPYNAKLDRASRTTYRFKDTYIFNGRVRQQPVERVVVRPDFLFSAADLSENRMWRQYFFWNGSTGSSGYSQPWQPFFVRTGTTNWWNSASSSTNADRNGPGVIRPPVKITFSKLRPSVETVDYSPPDSAYPGPRFGSFAGLTNAPIVYPNGPPSGDTNHLTIRLWLENQRGTSLGGFTWHLPTPVGGSAALQASTNLVDWVSLFSAVNEGVPFDWYHLGLYPQRFFRVLPQ